MWGAGGESVAADVGRDGVRSDFGASAGPAACGGGTGVFACGIVWPGTRTSVWRPGWSFRGARIWNGSADEWALPGVAGTGDLLSESDALSLCDSAETFRSGFAAVVVCLPTATPAARTVFAVVAVGA